MSTPRGRLLFVGTYTKGDSVGIYAFRFDSATGALAFTGESAKTPNPSFLAPSPDGNFLYAVSELSGPGPNGKGALGAWRIDRTSGRLSFINRQATHGNSPCHVVLDRRGRFVFAANYGSGTLAVLPVRADGSLGPASAVVRHQGRGADPRRQRGPHAHSMLVDDDRRIAYAADLGIDKVMIHTIDFDNGKLLPADPPFAQLHPGAGPRHMALHPNGGFLYVINELDSTVTVFRRTSDTPALTAVQTISALPPDFKGKSFCADIHVHPNGRFVYGSNRGHDSVVAYRIDGTTGTLACLGHTSTRGRIPRNFAFDPTGRFLLVANQESFNIVVFRVDAKTGALEFAGQETPAPYPVCLKFLPDPTKG
ncbi:MAG: lactonase family protein [Kiritimatiellaeota bacterium]|nr:lactonase family protein [Kiritimatiellota bacterium]